MAEPDIYAKFAELYIKHERLKAKYGEIIGEISHLRGEPAAPWPPLPRYWESSHRNSNAEYLLEQEDV